MPTMTTTTYGAAYSEQAQMHGILSVLDGGDYPRHQEVALSERLLAELRTEVDARLPEGVSWTPSASEFLHPVGAELPDRGEMAEIFEAAWAAVEARLREIDEAMFGGSLPATVEELEAALRAIGDPVHRAWVAGMLVSAGMRQMAGQVRAEAVREATQERGYGGRIEVAGLLEIGVPAVEKMIKRANGEQTS